MNLGGQVFTHARHRAWITLIAASVAVAQVDGAAGARAGVVVEVPPCAAAQLRAVLSLQGAGGHLVGPLRVQNRGRTCALRGRPLVTLRTLDGEPIRFRAHAATPHWRFASRSAPRNWPSVRLRRQQRAVVWIDLTNWCRPNGERVRFRFALPMAGGTLAADASVRLRCESAQAPVSVGVGPFEPVS